IGTRSAELIRRIDLFAERKADVSLWPFDQYFPGRIAIAILEALQLPPFPLEPSLQSPCITEACRRVNNKSLSKSDRRQWERVGAYIRLNRLRGRTMRILRWSLSSIMAMSLLIGLVMYGYCTFRKQIILIEFSPLQIHTMPNRPLNELRIAAAS